MGIGPSLAIPRVLEMTGLTIDDIDLFEVCCIYIFLEEKKVRLSIDQ